MEENNVFIEPLDTEENKTMKEKSFARRQKIMEKSEKAPTLFLEAWKQGVTLIGGEFFNQKNPLSTIKDKNELRPNYEYIHENIWVMSSGKKVLLALMCSFYNSVWGGDLITEVGIKGMSDISAKLDYESLDVVSELLVNYHGW